MVGEYAVSTRSDLRSTTSTVYDRSLRTLPLLSGAGRDKASLHGAIHRVYAVACTELGKDA